MGCWLWHLYSFSHSTSVFFFLLAFFSPLPYPMFMFVCLYCPLVSTHQFYSFFSLLYSNFALFVEISSWCTTLMITVHSFAQPPSFFVALSRPFAVPPRKWRIIRASSSVVHKSLFVRIGICKHPSIPYVLYNPRLRLAITLSSSHHLAHRNHHHQPKSNRPLLFIVIPPPLIVC